MFYVLTNDLRLLDIQFLGVKRTQLLLALIFFTFPLASYAANYQASLGLGQASILWEERTESTMKADFAKFSFSTTSKNWYLSLDTQTATNGIGWSYSDGEIAKDNGKNRMGKAYAIVGFKIGHHFSLFTGLMKSTLVGYFVSPYYHKKYVITKGLIVGSGYTTYFPNDSMFNITASIGPKATTEYYYSSSDVNVKPGSVKYDAFIANFSFAWSKIFSKRFSTTIGYLFSQYGSEINTPQIFTDESGNNLNQLEHLRYNSKIVYAQFNTNF